MDKIPLASEISFNLKRFGYPATLVLLIAVLAGCRTVSECKLCQYGRLRRMLERGQIQQIASKLKQSPALAQLADDEGNNLTHVACERGNYKAILCLSKYGAAFSPNNSGLTPLHCLAMNGQSSQRSQKRTEAVALVIRRTQNIDALFRGWTPLGMAVSNRALDLAVALLKSGADPRKAGIPGTTVNIIHLTCEEPPTSPPHVQSLVNDIIALSVKGGGRY